MKKACHKYIEIGPMYAKSNLYECEKCTSYVCVYVHTYRDTSIWETIIHGFLIFVHLVLAFVLDYLLRLLFSQQPWRIEIVSSSGTEGRGQDVRMKSIMSPSRVKAGQVHQIPSLKDYGFLKSQFLMYSHVTFCCLFEYVCGEGIVTIFST